MHVVVKAPSGCQSFDVCGSDTVGRVRAMAQVPESFAAVCGGRTVPDSRCVGALGPCGSLEFRPRLLGGVMIKVKTLTGKELEIDIEPTDTIERIKERVEEKEGIPPVQQRLIYSGKSMADDKEAREYNIEGGSVLHLVLALRGGAM
ncbi:unnamed protein product [Pedinophyceae sp. YPF-701]|nr:unnamed protein product [Pedinophyceae sp. YPF-701]